jgi:ribosomal protein S18 acetylase RimI-like enzyme
MLIDVAIRRARPDEYDSVRGLIEIVVMETFRDLFAPNPVPLKFNDEDWPLAWVAASGAKILGVVITHQEWVDDLWVLQEHRRQGLGRKLLAHAESEIAARGFDTCRLRVVKSNLVAVQFYSHQGWRIAREFAHEKYHHPMLEMAKPCPEP